MRRLPKPPSTLELLKRRRAEGSIPGKRKDPWKLWLVAGSGGQSGAIGGAFVSALEALGYRDCFDGFVGSSAGAMTLAYFAAGQAAMGTSIYADNNTGGQFLRKRRLFSWRPVMDLDYLVQQVMVIEKPLNCEALGRLQVPLLAVASTVQGEVRLLPLQGETPEEIRQRLTYSACIPFIARRRAAGQELWDGAMISPLPIEQAVAQGATHTLAIENGASLDDLGELSRVAVWLMLPWLRWCIPPLYERLRARVAYGRTIAAMIKGVPEQMAVMFLPDGLLGVGTTNRKQIWLETVRAYNHAFTLLGEDPLPLPPVWRRSLLEMELAAG